MPITSFTIQNFKGIRGPLRVELKPITLLFGPNSSGKSTIVQALHYAREIFERENVNPDHTILGGDIINLGGFENLVHKHDKMLPVILRFDLDLKDEQLPDYVFDSYEESGSDYWSNIFLPTKVRSAWVEIQLQWNEILKAPLVNRYSIGTNDEHLIDIIASDDGQKVNITKLNPLNPVFLKNSTVEAAKKNGIKLLIDEEEITDIERDKLGEGFLRLLELMEYRDNTIQLTETMSIIRSVSEAKNSAMPFWGKPLCIGIPSEVDFEDEDSFVIALSRLIVGTGELLRNALNKFCYLGPLRVVPPRDFQPAKTHDDTRWPNGMAAWDILKKSDKTFIDKINQWLYGSDRLNSGYKVIIKEYKDLDMADPIMVSLLKGSHSDEGENLTARINLLPTHRRLLLWEGRNRIEVQPLDIGVGISQLLPVIVAAISAKSGFVVIEQPELHAHPALQTALGDLFITQVKENPDVTFIIETHSEHLLLRILRRIREASGEELPPGISALAPEMLSIYFAESDDKGTILTSIRVDQDGEFVDRWPHGFFTERIKELY